MELIIRIDTAWVSEQDSITHLQTIQDTLSKVFYDVDLKFTISEGVSTSGYKYLYMVIEVEGQHGKSMSTQMSVLDKVHACIHMYVCTHQDTSAHLIEVFDTAKADWLEFIV